VLRRHDLLCEWKLVHLGESRNLQRRTLRRMRHARRAMLPCALGRPRFDSVHRSENDLPFHRFRSTDLRGLRRARAALLLLQRVQQRWLLHAKFRPYRDEMRRRRNELLHARYLRRRFVRLVRRIGSGLLRQYHLHGAVDHLRHQCDWVPGMRRSRPRVLFIARGEVPNRAGVRRQLPGVFPLRSTLSRWRESRTTTFLRDATDRCAAAPGIGQPCKRDVWCAGADVFRDNFVCANKRATGSYGSELSGCA